MNASDSLAQCQRRIDDIQQQFELEIADLRLSLLLIERQAKILESQAARLARKGLRP